MMCGLIPMEQVLRSPPLTTGGCPPASHSVLAPVSRRYPHHKGRLPTCSSPFRHSGASIAKCSSVRLACLIHAASVRSEPESNSHRKNPTGRAEALGVWRTGVLTNQVPSGTSWLLSYRTSFGSKPSGSAMSEKSTCQRSSALWGGVRRALGAACRTRPPTIAKAGGCVKEKVAFWARIFESIEKAQCFQWFWFGGGLVSGGLGKALCLPDARGLRPFGARGRSVEVLWGLWSVCVCRG